MDWNDIYADLVQYLVAYLGEQHEDGVIETDEKWERGCAEFYMSGYTGDMGDDEWTIKIRGCNDGGTVTFKNEYTREEDGDKYFMFGPFNSLGDFEVFKDMEELLDDDIYQFIESEDVEDTYSETEGKVTEEELMSGINIIKYEIRNRINMEVEVYDADQQELADEAEEEEED